MKSVKYWAAEIKYDKETDDYFIEFPPLLCEQMGWQIGDELVWKALPDGKFQLTKQDDNIDYDVGC